MLTQMYFFYIAISTLLYVFCDLLAPLDLHIKPQPKLLQKRFYFFPVVWSQNYLQISSHGVSVGRKELLFQFGCLGAIKHCYIYHNKQLKCHCHLLKETPPVIEGSVHFPLADKGSVWLSSVRCHQVMLLCAWTPVCASCLVLGWHFCLLFCLDLPLWACIFVFSFAENSLRL